MLKKEFPFINSLLLEEIFMKLETMNIINVFRVSKNKKMIVSEISTEDNVMKIVLLEITARKSEICATEKTMKNIKTAWATGSFLMTSGFQINSA